MKGFLQFKATKLLLLVVMLLGYNVSFGQYSGSGTFTKITSEAALTDGYYVIAFGSSQAMSNSHNGTFFARTPITAVSGTTISNPEAAIVWRIATDGTGRTIYNEATGVYVSYTGGSNNVQAVTSVIANNQRWNVSYNGTVFLFANAAVTGRRLQYNSNSGAERFATYTGGQQDLTLYKLAASAPVVTTPVSGSKTYTAAGSYNIASATTPNGTITSYSATPLPTGATFNSTNGVISFPANAVAAGTYSITIRATNATGTSNAGTLTYTVTKAAQTITVFGPGTGTINKITTDDDFSVATTATSGLAVTYTSSNAAVATVSSDGIVDLVGEGTTTITASQAGNTNYNAAPTLTRSLVVSPAPSLLVTPTAILGLDYIQGAGPSTPAAQLTEITGSNLSAASGNITVSTSGTPGAANFEVSTQSNQGFDASILYPYTGTSFTNSNPAIFVRLKSGLDVGLYTGTITLTGGGASTTFTVSGEVKDASTILTTETTYGPYCFGPSNTIQVQYVPQGTFDIENGDFYVQRSDAAGVFPNTLTNIIGFPNGDVSPIEATLPANLPTGNYRVRVVYFNGIGNVFVPSSNNSGSDILINALPTLASVTITPACAGNNAAINLNGLLINGTFTVSYTVDNGPVQNTTVTADITGVASFVLPITAANNGKVVTISALQSTAAPSCAAEFTTNNTVTIILLTNEWKGTVSTNWNDAANWSCGTVPTTVVDVVITASDNNPVITTGTANAHNLTINSSATLIVNTGTTLYVDNILTTTGNLTINNNGALLQSVATVNNTNTGNVTVIKNTNPLYRLDYTMWSSPVSGLTLGNFSPETSPVRFYEYKYGADPVTGIESESYFAVDPSTTFAPAKSYLVRMPNTSAVEGYNTGETAIPFNANFAGTPNNGTITTALSTSGNKYTAIGNPYASPINVADFFNQNAGNIDTTSGIYMWRKKNDNSASTYATLNLTTFVENKATGGGEDQKPFFTGNSNSWILSAGQGFLVRSADGVATPVATFNNSMRRPAPESGNQPILKPGTMPASRFWLNLTNNNGAFSQIAVAYMDNATEGLDYGYDAAQLASGESASLYSIVANAKLAIQARPAFNATDVVPVGFVANNAGNYTLELDHADGLFTSNQEIFVKDNLLNTVHNIKEGNYTFTTEKGAFANRFEIVYSKSTLDINNPELDANTVIVYKQGNTININSASALINNVAVYDVRGARLYNATDINANETLINGIAAQQQVLIIEVSTEKGRVSKKIIF